MLNIVSCFDDRGNVAGSEAIIRWDHHPNLVESLPVNDETLSRTE